MGLFSLILHLVRFLVPVVEDIFGLVYPILATAKAVVQEDSDAASQWLTYWTVYSVFVMFEGTSEWLISWLPLYNELKLLFVCWLVLPRFEGAAKIYESLVIPYFLKYEEEIDERLSEASVEAKRHLSTFIVYLVTEGSKLAGEKSMAGVSLFLRLTGFSSILGVTNDSVNENTIYAVATVVGEQVGEVIQDRIPIAKKEIKHVEIRHISKHRVVHKSRCDSSEEELEEMDLDMTEVKTYEENDEEKDDEIEPLQQEEEKKYESSDEEDEDELMRAEEGKELLDDFLAVIEDGIYLNVSTIEPDSSPRLRIVTLSGDRWRLLWSNLRQKGAASSLHLCTVSSIDSKPLCVSLVSSLPPKIVSFEAQGEEVHDVLSEGLRLLISDARLRSKQLLEPIAISFNLRLLRDAFTMMRISLARVNVTVRRSNRNKKKNMEL